MWEVRLERYFELTDDVYIPGRWELGNPVNGKGEEVYPWQFIEGMPLEIVETLVFPVRRAGSSLEFQHAGFTLPLVKPRLKELLERLGVGEEAQFFPARVESSEEPWFVLNATRLVDCIDESRCLRTVRWKLEDERPDRVGEYRVVEGLRVDPGRVGGARIFRPWGWRVLIVSEELQRAMEQEGMTGTRFTEV
jgi:hypothetical protein